MDTYFASQVEKHAREIPNKIAVIDVDGTEKTWKEFSDDVTRLSNSLLDLGLKKGDKIATIMYNGYEYYTVFMAAATIGLIIVGLDHRFTIQEAADLCERTNPKLIFSTNYPVIELAEKVNIEHVYVYKDDENPKALQYEALITNGTTEPIADELKPSVDDPLIIIFTSGTTGNPKGGLITHRNTWHISKNSCDSWEFTDNDRVMCYLPTSHVGCTHDQVTLAVYCGAAGICMQRFSPDLLMEIMEKHGATYIVTVPTIFRLLLLNVDFSKYDTTAMRCLVLSGEAVSAELANSVNKYFPNALVASSWGMTETAGFFTLTLLRDSMQLVADTEGAPRGTNAMKALRDDGEWADIDELGELCITGPQVVPGYMDEKDNIGTFFEKDGERWMKTGDTGYMDEMGYMHFVGRNKEMYISGGYNVYPPEIEGYLSSHPKINAAAVLGVPDPVWGEIGYAFIQPEENVELNVEEVLLFCKEGLADYKRPKKVFIRTDIPKTPIGKIEKKTLKNNLEKYTN